MALFLAPDIPENMREPLLDVAGRLGVGDEVAEENLHLTLAYLGPQPEHVLDQIDGFCRGMRFGPIRLACRELAIFGGKRPAALAMMVERVPELGALQEKVAQVARMSGVDLARRRFKPHITLVRFPAKIGGEAEARVHRYLAAQPLSAITGEATSLGLFQSTRRQGAVEYDCLARYGALGCV